MNATELEAIIRPLATADTQIVVDILGVLYDVQARPEWVDMPAHPDGSSDSYYRLVLTPEVPRDPERAGLLDYVPPEITPAERVREHGVKTKAAPAFLSRSKDKDRR